MWLPVPAEPEAEDAVVIWMIGAFLATMRILALMIEWMKPGRRGGGMKKWIRERHLCRGNPAQRQHGRKGRLAMNIESTFTGHDDDGVFCRRSG